MKGNIKGWNFKRAYAADGSNSTLEQLTAEKRRLEARQLEIPKIIAQLEASLERARNDIVWLESLGTLKRSKWEKEKGTTVEIAVNNYHKGIVTNTARIESLKLEQKQLPSKIQAIQKQLDTLVEGESKGLEKGLDKETAKEIRAIELQKEKERLAHERAIREAELKAEREKRELEAQQLKQQQQVKAEEKAGANQTKLFIGIGIALILLVGGIILYKRKMAKTATG
ncbi:LPXTG cell wall anchor domain-containing protein [Crocinitomix algicola]|uniref:LPXTG cell wall anchor domain-containing protein n=1 Tax=Crocinitomix algicola TaxID=1740263 RepID=UPI00082CAC12|nr:LPXTG cell wall anchor domain-containing protein [Crocinitomix algicola]